MTTRPRPRAALVTAAARPVSSTSLVLLAWLVSTAIARPLPARAEAPASRPATAPSAAGPTFAGEWETTYGPMRLAVRGGDAVEGAYGSTARESSIKGTLAGRRLTFTYAEPAATGAGWFELAADGATFRGRWWEDGSPAGWADWEGKRVGPPADPPDTFAGLWKTSYGRMRLRQAGDRVRGVYEFGGGAATITGDVTGRTLAFRYEQADGEKGEGTFDLAPDGGRFAGTWKASAAGADKRDAGYGGAWAGTRVAPQPGRVWLVVLEYPWEQDLAETEYSFGLMLRTYFARVPHVQVRHRFFQTEDDLRRWCRELAYLAEPVVLHVSSHGTTAGLTAAGGKAIGAAALAECLRDAGELRLVHFGSCLVAGGDVPRRIFDALGPDARFPISGYAKMADWAGSAVIDFTYLELVLARGMPPAQAAKQTRKMLSFAGDRGAPGDAIAPAGFVLVEPKPPAAQRPDTKPAAVSETRPAAGGAK